MAETAEQVMERLAGEGYSVQIEFWWGAVPEVAWHVGLWEGRVWDHVKPYGESEFAVPEDLAGVAKSDTPLNALLKAEGVAKGTVDPTLAGMPDGERALT